MRCVCNLGLQCGPNSTYSPCMTPCPASCADLAAPSECEQTQCVEGCQCATGFVLSNLNCVPYSECGCTYLDRYYQVSLLMHVKYYRLKVMMSKELPCSQSLVDHVSLYPSTRSWRRHLRRRIVHRIVNVLPLVQCVKQRAVETMRSALCTTPDATVIDVSCFTFTQHILTQNVFDKYIMHSFQSFPSLGMIQNWISYSKVNYNYGSPFLPWDKNNSNIFLTNQTFSPHSSEGKKHYLWDINSKFRLFWEFWVYILQFLLVLS